MSSNDARLRAKTGKTDKEKRDDFLANRLMVLLSAATAVIVALLLLKKNNINFEAYFIIYVLPYVKIAAGALFAAAAVYFIYKRYKKADESLRYFGSSLLLGVSAAVFGIALFFERLLVMGTVAAVIVALLIYFIYCFYQRDFFWFTVVTVIGALLMYSASLGGAGGTLKAVVKTAAKLSAFILPSLFIIAVLLFRRGGGAVMIGGRRRQLMKPGYRYYPFVAAAAVVLAGSAAAALLHGSFIFAMTALVAVYLVIAIIYTVKMI